MSIAPLRGTPLGRLKLIVGLAVMGLALAPANSGATSLPAAPQLDTATASGNTIPASFPEDYDVNVDVHSGPSGENPAGSVSFRTQIDVSGRPFDIGIGGPATCLGVTGNTAIIKFHAMSPDIGVDFGVGVVTLVDNGGSALDLFGTGLSSSPNDCSSGGVSGDQLNGRAAVFDAQPIPTAPSITSTVPTDGACGVSRTDPIVVVFDQPMDKPSVEAAFSLKRAVNGEPVSGSFSWSGNSLLFTPSAPLAAARLYNATVGTGARSLAGINLTDPKAWTFTTTPQPLIAFVYPVNGAAGIPRNAPVVVGFDTAMDKPSAQAAFSLKVKKTGAPVSGAFGWYGNALIFQPSANLAANTFYEARETNAAKNLASRPLASGRTWGFTSGH